jgi:SpoVK/Ycf46/Vps4 family AAA+-type ATPase
MFSKPHDCTSTHQFVVSVPMRSGVLLHGPSGAGKTTMVRAVAAQTGAIFAYVHGPELHSPHPGEAERALRQKFRELEERVERAISVGQCNPAVSTVGLLFIDEIDALCPKRSDGASATSSANPEARLVATLLTLMDGIDTKGGDSGGGASRARGKFTLDAL